MRLACCLLVCAALAAPACAVTATTADTGEIIFLEDSRSFTSIGAGAFGPAWEWNSQANAYDRVDVQSTALARELTASFDINGTAGTVGFRESAARQTDTALAVGYDFTVNDTVQFNSLFVSFYLPCDRYGGATLTFRDPGGGLLRQVMLPASFGDTFLFSSGAVGSVEVAAGTPVGYTVTFGSPVTINLQDNRAWSGREFEMRVDLLGAYAGSPVPAGTGFSVSFSVQFPGTVDFQLDPYSATSTTDTAGWTAYTLPWDSAPLDLSWLNETPAGTHGFVQVRDGKLAFEDGTPARFWGVCASAAANFPTHEQSELIAARMAKFGVNMVRTHHADAYWSNPNLFDESYGDTQHFDADALDRFDYFIYCLEQNGIYIYLDQLVHRQFTTGDGVVNADLLPPAAKPYTLFDPVLIALQKQFSHDLWTHVNPYTGLAYVDDPGIALMDFTNENDLLSCDVTVEPYATHLEQMWQDWATAHGVDPNQPVRYASQRTPDVLRFIDEVQKNYYAEMHAYLRSIGVRVPITGNTWLWSGANLPSQATMDYMDGHSYWDHPYDNYSRFHNRMQVEADPAIEGGNIASLAMSRLAGKPFVVSEWGHPWPNEWRAEGPLTMAALGAFQGWDGVLAYTYRHSSDAPVNHITGPFDTFNDPAVFGLMPAGALLFRRPDVTSAGPATAVLWRDADIFGIPQLTAWGGQPAYRSLVEQTRLVTALTTPTEAAAVVGPTDYLPTTGATWVRSDTGELWRDWSIGVATIDTPRAQAAYGRLGAGPVDLSDVSIEVTNPFAVVAVVSLDGSPLRDSRRILITAVGRVENTGMVYNVTRTQLRDRGTGPILVEPIVGHVSIRTERSGGWIYAIGADGTRTLLGQVATTAGALVIDLQASARTIYYEVLAAGRFPDVPLDHWAFDEIEACADAGIVAGYPDGTYRPALAVTRDQMAVYISRALVGGDDYIPTPPATPSFLDVPTDHWAFRYIECAAALDIVRGYGDGTYRPGRAVDRGQMAVFIARGIATPTPGEEGLSDYTPPDTPTFEDVTQDNAWAWCYKYVEYIAAADIVHGYGDGRYHPEYVCSRDQMAVYVARGFRLPI